MWGYLMAMILMVFALPLLGLAVGMWIDSDHRANLKQRRNDLGWMLVTDLPRYVYSVAGRGQPELICAEVVLANNAFMTFLGNVKLFFGGHVASFEGLMTRARQEAVTRLLESAAERGFNAVCNVRLEAVDIAGLTMRGTRRDRNPQVYIGIIAYGSAYHRQADVFPPPMPPSLLELPT